MKTELVIWSLLIFFLSCTETKRAKVQRETLNDSTMSEDRIVNDISLISPPPIDGLDGKATPSGELSISPASPGSIEVHTKYNSSVVTGSSASYDWVEEMPEMAAFEEKAAFFSEADYEGDYKKVKNRSVNGNITYRSGILTAGEVNDYSKWELWKDISENELGEFRQSWKIKPLERYTLQLTTMDGSPVVDATVKLYSKQGELLWTAKTDNTGKSELWLNAFPTQEEESVNRLSISVNYQNTSYKIEKVKKFHDGINTFKIPAQCDIPKKVDIAFVVDATGSMQDEIDYLKSELNDIIQKVTDSLPQIKLNTGSVFYRDISDQYVTKKSDFSSKIQQTTEFIRSNNAGGGGDFPEAVDQALDVAVNELSWSSDALARIMFLVLDAPPHQNIDAFAKLEAATKEAAKKGIRIVPVTCSGIDKSTEYLMRSFALLTNGTYVFLTDHSGVGNPHIKPTTDKYDVELLNALLMRVIFQFTHVHDCNENIVITDTDTLLVQNPETVNPVHNYEDSSATKTNPQPKSNPVHFEQFSWRYYPNPTLGIVNIESKDIDFLFITDISGKILQRLAINGQALVKADLSNFPTGTYFIKFEYKPDKWMSGKVLLVR